MKRLAKSRLMEAIHETAKGLYAGGAIDKVTMSQYDLLCLKPAETYDSERIKTLPRTIEPEPSGAAQKLMTLLDHKGLEGVSY